MQLHVMMDNIVVDDNNHDDNTFKFWLMSIIE